MTLNKIILTTLSVSLFACSCGQKTTSTPIAVQAYQQVSPNFDADSAYAYIDNQVKFGPRVPNSKGHVACGDYLVAELKRLGANVREQKMVVQAFDGTKLNSRNIIASYGNKPQNRVLLFAHWDTRPFSDQDKDKANHNKPLLGANDGGSGVGVLLEVARQLQQKMTNIGVDIIFFDSEDYGTPAFIENEKPGDWWCLGSQYWAKNPHEANYKARYGILLDMVGGKDAVFHRELYSMHYAKDIVEKVWSTGRQLGYGSYFVSQDGGAITDDHVPVIQTRMIPSVNVIQFDATSGTGFYKHWHTQKDDMDGIDKKTLKAVGQTILEVIYKEKEL